jgi:methylenetetrahydrofolate reductase (NADPH)
MGIRSESRLERVLHARSFAVTAEVVPPRGGGAGPVVAQARALVGYADAVNVTDSPTSSAHMAPLAGAAFVAQQGLEPVMQITTRDRNRLAITGDLLGGWALGVRNVLCLTGDPVSAGDHPEAREVHDLSVADLVRFAVGLRDTGRLLSGREAELPPRYFVGVADVPLAPDYDAARLEEKADAGADFVQTQIVYDVDALGAWAEQIRARGLFERMFVLAGVAPPWTAAAARYVRDRLPGVSVPDAVIQRLELAGDGAEEEGVRLTVEIIERLRSIPGIAGVHVMGLGHEEAVRRVIEAAGLLPRPEPPSVEEIEELEARRAADEEARRAAAAEAARRPEEEEARRRAEEEEARRRAQEEEARRKAEEEEARRRAEEEEAVRRMAEEEEARRREEEAASSPWQTAGPRFAPTRMHGAPEIPSQPAEGQPSQPTDQPTEARPEQGVPQQAAQPSGWSPTHVVPAGGMVAWQAPHPSAPQSARLQPGLPIQVVERLGAWARVVASNGWWGWVDGRMLS